MTMFSSFSDTISDKIGNLGVLTTTDKSNIVSAINEVNKYTIDLGTISGSNFNEFFKNACLAFLQLNPVISRVCNVTVTYSNVNYYYGTFTNVDNTTVLVNLTLAGGSTMWSGYHKTTSNKTVIYPYTPGIDQTAGNTIASIGTGKIAMYHDSVTYRCWVPLPFMANNSRYTIVLNGASQDNVGDVLSITSVTSKYRAGFELSIDGAYDYKKCGVSLNYSITFAA